MTLKSAPLAAALAAAFAMLSTPSQAADPGGFFLNGRVGRSALSKGRLDDSDTGYALNFGYRWVVAPNASIGVETGYADFGDFSLNRQIGSAKVSIWSWNLGANGRFNLDDRWYLAGRFGLLRANTEFDNTFFRVEDERNKWYAGLGVGYDVNDRISLGLNYDYYKADLRYAKFGFRGSTSYSPELVSLSGEYRF